MTFEAHPAARKIVGRTCAAIPISFSPHNLLLPTSTTVAATLLVAAVLLWRCKTSVNGHVFGFRNAALKACHLAREIMRGAFRAAPVSRPVIVPLVLEAAAKRVASTVASLLEPPLLLITLNPARRKQTGARSVKKGMSSMKDTSSTFFLRIKKSFEANIFEGRNERTHPPGFCA